MMNKPRTPQKPHLPRSGVMRRPVIEPDNRQEPPMPTTLPEMKDDDSGTTGITPVVSEGADTRAEREDDPAT